MSAECIPFGALGALLGAFLSACAYGAPGEERDAGRAPGLDAGPRPDGGLPGFDGGPVVVPDADMPASDGASPMPDSGPTGLCIGVDCSVLDGDCVRGECDPLTGECLPANRASGTPCDDADPCTEGDACSAGSCAGMALDCSTLEGPCTAGACDPATGACTAMPAREGASCDTDAADCADETCASGACVSRARADCSACGSGGTVCSAGSCGAGPTMLAFDFEGGLPSGWRVGGGAGWVVDGSRPHAGAMSAHSGAISHGGTSTMTADLTVAVAARLSFWLTTSTESGYDYLEIWVDGARQGQWSGSRAWTQASVELTPGAHVVEWRYTKDGSASVGDDRVWIDDVAIVASTVEGFESASLPSGWTTSGSGSWFTDTTRARSGLRSARSGSIGNSQQTSLSRTVTLASAGTLRFWYTVSSESSFDFLELRIDGVLQTRWSGAVAWTLATYPLGAGTHTVEWRYAKDGSLFSGSDAAWIDDVELGDPPAVLPSLCGP